MTKPLSRRKFLAFGASALAGALTPDPFGLFAEPGPLNTRPASFFNPVSKTGDATGTIFINSAPARLWKWSKEARYYETLPGDAVMCGLCPHSCVLENGDRGICRSRVNKDGRLFTLAYGNPCSVNLDPIEKKPLFHFHPTTRALSFAAAGCNFRCLNCQNWQISQARPEDLQFSDTPPQAMVAAALAQQAESIAYTYSEPVTWYEFMMDTARIAKSKGIFNLLISNGYIQPEPLSALCEVIDAANVNLKAFDDPTYRTLNGGTLSPVQDTFRMLHQKKVHFEMTTLVVPGYSDNPKMIQAMCRWIMAELGPDHPYHLLRFFPQYKLDRLAPTPVSLLTDLRKLAMDEGIRYVYVGNVPGHEGVHTWCHECKKLLIERKGYTLGEMNIKNGKCRFCGTVIPGAWG